MSGGSLDESNKAAATYIGASIGPVIGGILNQHLGWQSIFVIIAILAVIAFIVAMYGYLEQKLHCLKKKKAR